MQYSNQHFTSLNDNCLAVRCFLLKSRRKKATYHWGNNCSFLCSKNGWNNTWKTTGEELKCFPLSANTVGGCIGNIAENLKKTNCAVREVCSAVG